VEAWELAAREGIRDTLARYAHWADRGRFIELANLFTEDGVLHIHEQPPIGGREAILAFLTQTRRSLSATLQQPYIRHHVSSIVIDLQDATHATASSYFLAITEHGPDHWGRYRDQLVRIGDRWLFRHRRVRADGHSQHSWRATRKSPQ
jgi:hypothetical protein